MNIYLCDKIEYLYFIEDEIMIHYSDDRKQKINQLDKFLVECMLKEINSLEEIVRNAIESFGITDKKEVVLDRISEYIKDKQYIDTTKNDNEIKIFGEIGKKYPETLDIELTNGCNLNCSHCYKRANDFIVEYIDYTMVDKVCSKLKDKARSILLTGGEATTHPEFVKIVNRCHEDFEIDLMSNGLRLHETPVEVLKKFNTIGITIYGLDSDEYYKITKNKTGYEQLYKSCELLKEHNIEYYLNIVLNDTNFNRLEEYILLAEELGATYFKVGVANKVGRAIEDDNFDTWSLSKDSINSAYKELRMLKKKYKDKIEVLVWGRESKKRANESEKICSNGLPCGAGIERWCMSEKGDFRPCSMISPEFITLNYDKWESYIEGEYDLMWCEQIKRYEKDCKAANVDLAEMCEVFEQLLG